MQDTGLVQNAPNASLSPELWMLSSCRRLVFDAVSYTMQPESIGTNNGTVQHQECVSVPSPFKWATTRMRLRASLHCVFSTLMCFLNERWESHHSPRNFVDSSTGKSVFQILTMGGLWARDRGQWNVWHCTCGLQPGSHSLSPIPVWHSLPAVDVSLWCPEGVLENRSPGHRQRMLGDVLGNTRGQLINLQSRTCHSQDTASWNTLLWVEFVRECCPNFDSDSPVPEIFWHKNRQSAAEANPVKIPDDAILPGCLIGFLQVKEETNCLLPLRKGIPEIYFKAHHVVGRATMFSETALSSV